MRHITHSSLRATAVIATVLALGSTPALAQDAAAPVVAAPPAAADAPAPAAADTATAPRITLPDTGSAPAPAPQAVSGPVVERVAAPAPPPAPAMAAPMAATVAPRTAARAPKPSTASNTPASAAGQVRASAAKADAEPVAAASPAMERGVIPPQPKAMADEAAFNSGSRVDAPAPTSASRPTAPMPGESGMIAGGAVVLLGLGGVAALLASRRRRAADPADEPVETVAPRPIMPAAEPARAPAYAPAEPFAAAAGAPVPHGEAREALIRSMVDAAPDAANPFTSAKARRRRARLILQAREQREGELGQGELGRPFDFRSYRGSNQATGTAEATRPPEIVVA